MEISTQDRLKAFLGRNRVRNSDVSAEREETSTAENIQNRRNSLQNGNNDLGSLSSRLNHNSSNYKTMPSNILGMSNENRYVNYTEGNEYIESSPQQCTMNDMRDSKIKKKSFLSMESPLSRTHRSSIKNEKTPSKTEVKKNNSTSPIRETKASNKNLIESYVSGKKKIETKIRDQLKNFNKEPKEAKKLSGSIKSNSLSLNYQSNSKQQFASTSEVSDTPDTSSARNNRPRTPVKEQKEPRHTEKKVDKSLHSSALKRQSTSVFSSGVKKIREEKHEYAFEEAQGINKGNKSERDTSRSKSRSVSATPKTVNKREKTEKLTEKEKDQQAMQRQNLDKSSKLIVEGSDELFPESSKKLKALDSNANNETKFKKEIQKLIEIIKSEKEHISKNMEAMSKELTKYKTAYKKMKKKYQNLQEKREVSGDFKISKNNENILSGAVEVDVHNSFHNSAQYSSTNEINKALSMIKKQEENYVPFTIDELNRHLDNNLPSNIDENPIELLSKMDNLNLDVQNILTKNAQDENLSNKDSNYNSNIETHSFQLRKNPINCYIIKEMNLGSHLFFQDSLKEIELDSDFQPTVIDLLAAQREIIHFLIRKIDIEEKQRLKTENQTALMITQMEKTIKQLEERALGTRKRESASTTELNKSIVSQNAS
uniref:Predicted protein n=1 Tax=Hordeum vulgare subsp. vulgare TaxID=112509 RepID=F2E527_HORVV|nr:predicted protein [Hordeum vulgare subsp. vulgare]